MEQEEKLAREALAGAKRVVIKLGTRVIVQRNGRPDPRRLRSLVREIAALQRSGKEIIVVTSGAIGSGMEVLGLKQRPKNLPDLQMAAAIGQVRLMSRYDTLFRAERCKIGQVLLTHDVLQDRQRHLMARNTMLQLLRNRVIPIVNENDAIAVDEIKFGDNDLLAALVSLLVEADALVLLTTVNGLRNFSSKRGSKRISYLPSISRESLSFTSGKGSELSVGGMESKLKSAQMVVESGGVVAIANGKEKGTLEELFCGKGVGTIVGSGQRSPSAALPGRKRWIAFFNRTEGTVTIDDGARSALERNGHSLLPIGVKKVDGVFSQGSLVNVCALDGTVIARGLVDYSSEDLERIRGRKSSEIAKVLGSCDYQEVIHRDNMVILRSEVH